MEPGRRQKRVEAATDLGISPLGPLQGHLTPNGLTGRRIVGMEGGGAVVALDDGKTSRRAQHAPRFGQGSVDVRQVLQHEADEDVVERRVGERESP